MRRFNSTTWLVVSLLISISLSGWSHFESVRQNRADQQRQTLLETLNRDCKQLQIETDEHYRKGKILIAKKPWTKVDMALAEHFSEKSKALDARSSAIQRRYDKVCAHEK